MDGCNGRQTTESDQSAKVDGRKLGGRFIHYNIGSKDRPFSSPTIHCSPPSYVILYKVSYKV